MTQANKKHPDPLKKTPPRRDRLEARVAREQKILFQKAADLQGKSLTDFLIHSAWQEALKTIQEHETLILSAQDQTVFMETLLAYTSPNEALRSAARQYRQNHPHEK